MKFRLIIASLLIVVGGVVIGALSACGGDRGASKDTFIAAADAICRQANTVRDTLLPQPGPSDHAEWVVYADTLRAAYGQGLKELNGLTPPDGDEEEIRAMLADFARATARIGGVAAASRRNDTSASEDAFFDAAELAVAGQKVAREYGLADCVRFGIP